MGNKMTTINELQGIVEYTRSLNSKNDKLSYLYCQSKEILNFLSKNIKKDGIAKTIASEIPINNESISDIESITKIFSVASTLSSRTSKIRMMKSIWLSSEDREFVLTTLYGSLKLGVTIPTPEPEFGDIIKPALCNTKFKFNLNDYIEEKFNGHRCITMNIDNKIYTYTRNGKILDINDSIKEYFKMAIPIGSIVDGEIIDSSGDFYNLKRKGNDIIYMIFDIIFKDKNAIIDLPLKDRLVILKDSIIENAHVKVSQPLDLKSIEEIDLWIITNNAEGIISKDLNSSYIYNSRKTWAKYKHFQDITCKVIGFTQGEGKYDRDDMIGALKVIPEGYNKITFVGSGLDILIKKGFKCDN
jgi:ATP-dependent DNA ligase